MAEDHDKDQRTEDATPRHTEEARERGQVALSTELIAALGLCTGFGALVLGGGRLAEEMARLMVETFSGLPTLGVADLGVADSAGMIQSGLDSVARALALVVLPPIAISLLVGYGQVGFRVTPKAIEPDLSKFDPVKGMSRLFGIRSVVRTGLAAAKILAIALTTSVIAWSQVGGIVRLGGAELGPLLLGLGRVAVLCTGGSLIVILCLGVVDLFFQRYQHKRDLRMTKQEVKDERRLSDGDPHVKARIRRIQTEMATRRMMADVPKATVVVTNPTHYAVALRYERDAAGRPLQDAPVVVAKGVDSVAQRIKAVASSAGVATYEDVPLARSLYAQTKVGHAIPQDLYAAVATVLSHVFGLRRERVGAG